jgi:hypothetical protein
VERLMIKLIYYYKVINYKPIENVEFELIAQRYKLSQVKQFREKGFQSQKGQKISWIRTNR